MSSSAAIVTPCKGAETGWSVDFWLDPACPLTRNAARWISQIANHVRLNVRWRVMSLSVLNEHREDDPEDDPHGYLWIPARVAAAIQAEHGHDALGAFYDALWTDPDGAEREWIGDFTEALQRASLPIELAESGTSTDYDTELRTSHDAGIGRIDAEVGSPILAITNPDGAEYALFGPVLSALPTDEEAIRLWEATLLLTSIPTLREIKR